MWSGAYGYIAVCPPCTAPTWCQLKTPRREFLEVHRVVHVVPLGPRLCEDASWLVIIIIVLASSCRRHRNLRAHPLPTSQDLPSAVGLIPLVLRLFLHLERVDLPLVVALLPVWHAAL